jgi:ribonuclease P protein component
VRKRRAYLQVQSDGRRLPGRYFLLLVRARSDEQASGGSPMAARARFGITVTRKVGNAVTRNRIKRVVRESCRRVGDLFPGDVDVVVVARAAAAEAGLAETMAELSGLARRLGTKSVR